MPGQPVFPITVRLVLSMYVFTRPNPVIGDRLLLLDTKPVSAAVVFCAVEVSRGGLRATVVAAARWPEVGGQQDQQRARCG